MADQKTNEEVMTAVTELRATVEKKGFIDKEKVKRLNVVLDGYEDKNQQITIVEQQAKSLIADIAEIKKLPIPRVLRS